MSTRDEILSRKSLIKSNNTKLYEKGRADEYSDFWDDFQIKGSRTNYEKGFAGSGWTGNLFYPKYNIKPTRCDSLFQSASSLKIDLVERLNECGVVLDFSNCTGTMGQAFAYSGFTHIGDVDASKTGNVSAIFANCKAVKIDSFTVPNNTNIHVHLSTAFANCTNLVDIVIKGTITQSINFIHSPLSPDSMKSIISCLKDFRDESQNLNVYTIAFSDVCWTALEASGKPYQEEEWTGVTDETLTWKGYVESLGWKVV